MQGMEKCFDLLSCFLLFSSPATDLGLSLLFVKKLLGSSDELPRVVITGL